MLYTQVKGRKVVSTGTAETVGRVADLVIDPRSRTVVAVTLRRSGHADTVLWSDITAFGTDAVTVPDGQVVKDANHAVKELSGKAHDVLGKRVLTTLGEALGSVSDVEFDPESGAVNALVLPSGDVAGSRLVGVGPYAAIVHAG